jgi:hypothetical protein
MKFTCPKRNHCNYRAQIHAIGLPKSEPGCQIEPLPRSESERDGNSTPQKPRRGREYESHKTIYARPFGATETPAW